MRIKTYHVAKKIAKLIKKDSKNYKKAVNLAQQTVLQRYNISYQKIQIIAKYISFNFKNVISKIF